jgi:hypothetical protein
MATTNLANRNTNGVVDQYATTTTGGNTNAVDSRTSSNGNTSSVATGNENQTGSSNTVTQNMDPKSMAMLQVLIQQLMSGGTQQQIEDKAARKTEINNVTQQRAGYSKEAAFADSQGLMAQTMRRVLEQLVPGINRGAEGAGTSAGSMKALLLNDAATKAAENASANGLNAAVQYGGVANGMSGILEALTRPNDATTTALLNAFQVLKGANTASSTNSAQSGTKTTNTQGTTSENKTTDYAPFQTVAPSAGGFNLTSYGPAAGSNDINYAALVNANTSKTIQELVSGGGSNFSNNITF